jgi:stage V sporulation protein G
MNVKITVRKYESANSKTKAFIELKLDEVLIVKGLSLVKGKNGLFLSFPSSKGKDNKYYNSVYSLDKDWKAQLEEACIKKYNESKNSSSNTNGDFC